MADGAACLIPVYFDLLIVAAPGTKGDGVSFARIGAVPQPAVTSGALQVGGVGRGKSGRHAERIPGRIIHG